MKHFGAILLLCAVSIFSFAQAPALLNYQAVARDMAGTPLPNKTIGIKISILRNTANGPVAYAETHKPVTNQLGLFAIQIGSGTAVAGNLSSVDWGSAGHFLQLELDPNGDNAYQLVGASQLVSVPYALYAEHGGPWKPIPNGIRYLSDACSTVSDTCNGIYIKDGRLIIEEVGHAALELIADVDGYNDGPVHFGIRVDENNPGLHFEDLTNASTRLFLDHSGNVGMGTTSPEYPLHIKHSTDPIIKLERAKDSYSLIMDMNSIRTSQTGPDGFLSFGVDGKAEDIYISSPSRFVGIGTITPKSKLQVHGGDVYIEDVASGVIMKSPNGNCWRMTVDNSGQPVFSPITCPN